MNQRIPKAIGLVACVVTTLIATQSAALANPFPNNDDETVADNAVHTYCYTSGFTTDASVGAYAMAVLGNTTDMDDLFPIDPPTCQFMETDVWWFESNLPAGDRGRRDCYDYNYTPSPDVCTSSDVDLDFPELDDAVDVDDWEDRRKTAVHEVGHSVGLGHDTISTMIQGEIPDTSLTWRTYSAHDIAHINGHY
jgi:hypothetical protein